MIVYVGTSTGPNKAEGIGVFRMDESTGALAHLQTIPADNPTFLALHPSGRTLYAVTRRRAPESDHVLSFIEAFAIDPHQGTLSPIGRRPSGGQSPSHVSVHPGGRCLFAANIGSGHVAALPVNEDGSLGDPASVIQHQGGGPDPRRQQGPHPHFIQADVTGERALACDLGCDRVYVYRVDPDTATLTPNDVPYAQVSSGAGARHLAFHPGGTLVFVINELDSTLSSFAYDSSRGILQIRDTRSTLPDGYAERSHTAQVLTHPNGRFVYGSNRGHDSIAIFSIDQQTGELTLLGHEPTQGTSPRNFNLDPSGTLLLAANENSHTIVPFHVDPHTGALTPTGQVAHTPSPTCIQFLADV